MLYIALIAVILCFVPQAFAFQGPHAQFVTMTDGLGIDIDLRWPDGTPPAAGWPAVLLAHGAGLSKASLSGLGGSFADMGYVTLAYSGRGDGASTTGGDPSDTSALRRGNDINDLVTWLINQMPTDVSPANVLVDGTKIGMTGSSQGGINSWYGGLLSGGLIAPTNVPQSLAAISPNNFAMHTWPMGFIRNGSITRNLGGIGGLQGLIEAYNVAGFPTPSPDDTTAIIPNMTTPVMTQHAMHDSWDEGGNSLRDFLAATGASARKVYIGTGGHGTPNSDNAYRNQTLRNRWLAFWLKGDNNGILGEPDIHFSLLDTLEKIAFDTFPHPNETRHTLYLGASGALSSTAPSLASASDTFDNDPGAYTAAAARAANFSSNTYKTNFPQETITYTSAPLTEDVVVLGFPSANLFVDGTASDRYQINIHLTDVPPAGTPRLLAFGTFMVDAAGNPGGAELDFDMSITGRRIVAGNRIGVTITNLDVQEQAPGNTTIIRYLPFFEVSTNTVFREIAKASSISIPIIEGTLPGGGSPMAEAITASIAQGFIEEGDLLVLTAPTGTSYQWKRNGVNLGGETGAQLLFDPVTESDEALYVVQYDNGQKAIVQSLPYVLAVLPAGSLPLASLALLATIVLTILVAGKRLRRVRNE